MSVNGGKGKINFFTQEPKPYVEDTYIQGKHKAQNKDTNKNATRRKQEKIITEQGQNTNQDKLQRNERARINYQE